MYVLIQLELKYLDRTILILTFLFLICIVIYNYIIIINVIL